MRWQICVAALAMTACVWAEGAEDKPAPATARQSMEDPVSRLEREEAMFLDTVYKIGLELDMVDSARGEDDAEKRSAAGKKSQALNAMRNLNQFRLNELTEQLRQKRKEQLQQAFGEECTLTITDKEPIRIAGVSLVNVLNVAGRQMLQFRSKSDGTLWTIDPQRIVMAQITR